MNVIRWVESYLNVRLTDAEKMVLHANFLTDVMHLKRMSAEEMMDAVEAAFANQNPQFSLAGLTMCLLSAAQVAPRRDPDLLDELAEYEQRILKQTEGMTFEEFLAFLDREGEE